MAEPIFQANNAGVEALRVAFNTAAQQARSDAYRVLRIWAQEYKARVQKVVPREFGTLAQSWQVQTEDTGTVISATLGTSIKSRSGAPYPQFLEFGTTHIAHGQVLSWVQGEPPIMEWPAKMADLPNFRLTKNITGRHRSGGTFIKEHAAGREGSAKFERSVLLATKAFTAGAGEQMPFLRPIGYEIAPRVVEDLRVAIRDGVQAVLDGRRF